ncbi:MAG: hypothetical protein WC679_13590, partial [Bacteroidales bacterium]
IYSIAPSKNDITNIVLYSEKTSIGTQYDRDEVYNGSTKSNPLTFISKFQKFTPKETVLGDNKIRVIYDQNAANMELIGAGSDSGTFDQIKDRVKAKYGDRIEFIKVKDSDIKKLPAKIAPAGFYNFIAVKGKADQAFKDYINFDPVLIRGLESNPLIKGEVNTKSARIPVKERLNTNEEEALAEMEKIQPQTEAGEKKQEGFNEFLSPSQKEKQIELLKLKKQYNKLINQTDDQAVIDNANEKISLINDSLSDLYGTNTRKESIPERTNIKVPRVVEKTRPTYRMFDFKPNKITTTTNEPMQQPTEEGLAAEWELEHPKESDKLKNEIGSILKQYGSMGVLLLAPFLTKLLAELNKKKNER